eukprot:TRINITY_DN114761_c0_g1_i1.p1 TRINITY_DN114761_c0_g1~~TRINITY_DN114761_c0_g1_i1.p1  ORF type:complete len:369 (-),score=70.44 TRINITY_DN114761_c0_g1_i1:98-1144(-)
MAYYVVFTALVATLLIVGSLLSPKAQSTNGDTTHVAATPQRRLVGEDVASDCKGLMKTLRVGQKERTDLLNTYPDVRFSGATDAVCSFAGRDDTSEDIVVKLARPESTSNFEAKCKAFGSLYTKSCAKNDEKQMIMLRQYVPGCVTTAGSANEIMVVKAPRGGSWPTPSEASVIGAESKKAIFAQLVAAIFTLHNADLGHNHLTPDMTRLDTSASPPRVSLAFGDADQPAARLNGEGYKRDANALWERTATLLGCEEVNTVSAKSADVHTFLDCVNSTLVDGDTTDASKAFLNTFREVCMGGVDAAAQQKIEELFQTDFVQEMLPGDETLYAWPPCPASRASSIVEMV